MEMKNKTLEEVKKHCIASGYDRQAITQICAFLVGAGLKSTKDVLRFKIGEKTFEDFVKWFNSKTEELVLERGRFVLIDNEAEVYPALILDVFEDSCLTLSDTGLFCITNEQFVGYASAEDITHVLESINDLELYWDCDKKKLLPAWHVQKKYNNKDTL